MTVTKRLGLREPDGLAAKRSKISKMSTGSLIATWNRLLVAGLGCYFALFIARDGLAHEDEPPAESPNIILLMADDLGWGDPAYFGESPIQTPGLDQMARDGMRLDRFYAAAPVCSPTRASCLTGRHPYRMGIYFANVGHLLEREVTLPELLSARGYRTGHFGKWHLGTMTTAERDSNRGGPQNRQHYSPPNRHGYDHFFATEAKVPTYDPLLKRPDESNQRWWEPLGADEPATAYGTAYWENGRKVDAELRGDDSGIIVDQAIEFIGDGQPSGQPFLSVIWFHAPHLPVVGSPEWLEVYADVESAYARHYYASVSAMDESIQRLREHLARTGIDENTLIFFCSDNGPEGNRSAPGQELGLRGRKRSLYEGGIRVPGIVVWPQRIEPGTVSTTPMVTSDYLPTICELLDIELPAQNAIDGESIVSVFDDEPLTRRHPIFFESRNQFVAISERYKIVGSHTQTDGRNNNWHDRDSPRVDEFELFDLIDDPIEQHNIAAQHPEVVGELYQQLVDWRREVQADRTNVTTETNDR